MAPPVSAPPVAAGAAPVPESGLVTATRALIWLYLILWVVEGSFRKWFLVSMSDVLLVIRDPVALMIYALAMIGRFFPFNAFFIGTILLAALSAMAGFAVIPDLPAVVAFGLRANYLHLPLIFVMARVLRAKDLKWMAWFILAGAVPQAILMAKQYRSGIDSWWNLGAGGGRMIEAAQGIVRPGGTFSFISGPIFYFALCTAFILGGLTLRNWVRWWLLVPSLGATFLAAAVSGSRSLLIGCCIVAACFLLGCLAYPRAIKALAKLFALGLVAFVAVAGLNVFQAGRATTADRATRATDREGGLVGVAERALSPIAKAFQSVLKTDLLGEGLGLGTNGGAALTGSRGNFLISEDEWTRSVGESGPVIGLSYMGMRVVLCVWLLVQCLKAARTGNLLPLVLLGAGGPGLIIGQFGQPTAMGATVFFTGLCLAALSIPKDETIFVDKASAVTAALDSAKAVPAAKTKQAKPMATAAASLPDRKTPFNVVPRAASVPEPRETPPPPAPVPPETTPDPVIPRPAYKPGRFAIHSPAKKPSDE